MTPDACLLGGTSSAVAEIKVSLVDWLEPDPLTGRIFEDLPRCVDREACRARVEAAGASWEVRDRTIGTLPPPHARELMGLPPGQAQEGPIEEPGDVKVPEWM